MNNRWLILMCEGSLHFLGGLPPVRTFPGRLDPRQMTQFIPAPESRMELSLNGDALDLLMCPGAGGWAAGAAVLVWTTSAHLGVKRAYPL